MSPELQEQINRERYESLPVIRCPVCDRIVRWHELARNLAGEKVMVWHYHPDTSRGECAGSMRSINQLKGQR